MDKCRVEDDRGRAGPRAARGRASRRLDGRPRRAPLSPAGWRQWTHRWLALLTCLAALGGLPADRALASGPSAPRCADGIGDPARVLAIERGEGQRSGALQLTNCGVTRILATDAIRHWARADGARVYYSTPKGAGGYENEGQALWVVDSASGVRKRLMAAYFPIDDVIEQPLTGGRTALIVSMHDSGLGAAHTAVVDPARGEVFLRRKAKLLGSSDRLLTLGLYDDDDWEILAQGRALAPRRVVSYDLARVLRGRAMIRKHTSP